MSAAWDYGLLCFSAAAAGAVNALAGGGTLLTFPVLEQVLGGTPAALVQANATSTVALFPGSVAALGGYREDIGRSRRWIALLILPSLVGGLIGTLLVTMFDPVYFKRAVPWLILTAATLFTLQPLLTRWTGIGKPHDAAATHTILGVVCFQLAIALYGGYFGAGIGILMLAGLAFLGLSDIHQMNGLKSLLGSCINGMSVAVFIWQGQVVWSYALAMAAASIVGAYVAARVARRLDKTLVRNVVTLIGISLAIYYFGRQGESKPTPPPSPAPAPQAAAASSSPQARERNA